MSAYQDTMPLGDARELLREQVYDGAECPCCKQFAKVYKRPLNAQIARALIAMYRAGTTDADGYGEWVHVPTLLARKGADEAKARYWGLIEERPGIREDGSSRVGWWRLTPRGIAFVRGNITVAKYARIYDGRCLRIDGPQVSIRDVLGVRFNYDDLMWGTA